MEKKLICYDIDGTLTTEMLFVPLIASEHEHGFLGDVSYGDILATLKAYKSGEVAYEDAVQSLIEKHADGLKDKELTQLENHASNFINSHTDLFRPFGRKVVEVLKNTSFQVAVTAEPRYVAKAVANYMQLNDTYASEYEVVDGRFTGNIIRSLAHRSQKAELLSESAIFAAFGDSEGDIDMLSNAKHAICINPSTGLRAEAETHGWLIARGELEDSSRIIEKLIA